MPRRLDGLLLTCWRLRCDMRVVAVVVAIHPRSRAVEHLHYTIHADALLLTEPGPFITPGQPQGNEAVPVGTVGEHSSGDR
jgi:hypothetical protein